MIIFSKKYRSFAEIFAECKIEKCQSVVKQMYGSFFDKGKKKMFMKKNKKHEESVDTESVKETIEAQVNEELNNEVQSEEQ